MNGSLLLFPGSEGGKFIKDAYKFDIPPLKGLHTISAGDIDGDMDLDLFIGQWKAPYIGGSMPTPYYNANDGYPDYLLRNEGDGTFVNITNNSGLSKKSNRRTFSASLVDLDFDQDLDLIVVADFSGLDLYLNDGKGNFSDITDQLGKDRHAFGMSHTFGDWNSDGIEDLCLVGMSSTTARRLDGLGISKPGYEKYSEMRAPMTFGNRLFVRNKEGELSQPSFTAGAARSGWSWVVQLRTSILMETLIFMFLMDTSVENLQKTIALGSGAMTSIPEPQNQMKSLTVYLKLNSPLG